MKAKKIFETLQEIIPEIEKIEQGHDGIIKIYVKDMANWCVIPAGFIKSIDWCGDDFCHPPKPENPIPEWLREGNLLMYRDAHSSWVCGKLQGFKCRDRYTFIMANNTSYQEVAPYDETKLGGEVDVNGSLNGADLYKMGVGDIENFISNLKPGYKGGENKPTLEEAGLDPDIWSWISKDVAHLNIHKLDNEYSVWGECLNGRTMCICGITLPPNINYKDCKWDRPPKNSLPTLESFSISWKDALNFIAIDADGDVYTYEDRPLILRKDKEWENLNGSTYRKLCTVTLPPNTDFTKLIWERPKEC